MEKMFNEIEKVNQVIDGVFDTFVSSTDEDKYMARMVHARFTLNSANILADLKELKKLSDEERTHLLPLWIPDFQNKFQACVESKHGFGGLVADRYGNMAAQAMMEIIDSWLALS